MASPLLAVTAVMVTTTLAAGCWRLIVPRLSEPATSDAATDDAPVDDKIPYAQLATLARTVTVTGAAAAAAATSWATVPIVWQPLWTVLSVLGIVLAAIDGYTTWIPALLTRWTWAAMAAAAATTLVLQADWTDLGRVVVGALAAGALYLVLWLVTRGGFGFGDVRFAPLVAAPLAALGWTTLITGLLLGSLLGVVHGVWRRLRGVSGVQPWAPTLTGGAYLAAVLTAVT